MPQLTAACWGEAGGGCSSPGWDPPPQPSSLRGCDCCGWPRDHSEDVAATWAAGGSSRAGRFGAGGTPLPPSLHFFPGSASLPSCIPALCPRFLVLLPSPIPPVPSQLHQQPHYLPVTVSSSFSCPPTPALSPAAFQCSAFLPQASWGSHRAPRGPGPCSPCRCWDRVPAGLQLPGLWGWVSAAHVQPAGAAGWVCVAQSWRDSGGKFIPKPPRPQNHPSDRFQGFVPKQLGTNTHTQKTLQATRSWNLREIAAYFSFLFMAMR